MREPYVIWKCFMFEVAFCETKTELRCFYEVTPVVIWLLKVVIIDIQWPSLLITNLT